MAGYRGYSMSNNAIAAYQDGEMPLSKWKKSDIIDYARKYAKENEIHFEFQNLEKIPAKVLKEKLLRKTSWHHTSKMYNRTSFYSLDEYMLDNLTDKKIKEWKMDEAVEKEPEEEKWECEYLVWTGTRKYPKANRETAVGTIKGNWFFLPDGTKKSTEARGFNRIRKIG